MSSTEFIPAPDHIYNNTTLRLERRLKVAKKDKKTRTALQLASLAVTPNPTIVTTRKSPEEMSITVLSHRDCRKALMNSPEASAYSIFEMLEEFRSRMPDSSLGDLGAVAVTGLKNFGTKKSPHVSITLDSPELEEEMHTAYTILDSIADLKLPKPIEPHLSIAQFHNSNGYIPDHLLDKAAKFLPGTINLSHMRFA